MRMQRLAAAKKGGVLQITGHGDAYVMLVTTT